MDTNVSGLEKSGSILLTEEDILLARQGIVSDRVKATWNLTLAELQEVVNNNYYNKITN